MNLLHTQTRTRLLLALTIVEMLLAVTLLHGCILADDFGQTNGPQTSADGGSDAAPDALQDTGADEDTDTGLDASDNGDASGDAADAGDDESFVALTPTPKQCPSATPIFRVAQTHFGSASGQFFSSERPTVYDIGQASADMFPNIWLGHAVVLATTSADNELAIGWATVDVEDLAGSSETDSPVMTAPVKFSGGELIALPEDAEPLVVHDVEIFGPNEGELFGMHQFYNFLIFTSAGSYGCRISGRPEAGALVEPQVNCAPRGLLDAKLTPYDLVPITSFDWLPVRNGGRNEIVAMASGGSIQKTSGLIRYDTHSALFADAAAIEADNSIQWSSELTPLFTAATLAWGWPAYANDYPLVYMLDHRHDPRAVELAYSTGEDATAGYFESPDAPHLPLSTRLDLAEGKFAFTYRLFGSAIDATESHEAGFIGLDKRARGVIFGQEEPVDDGQWLAYLTEDVTKLWSFPTGRQALLAFARGNNRSRLDLASWNFDTELRTVPGAVTSSRHDVSRIDDVQVHSTWYYSATAFPDLGYKGLLGLTAETSGTRNLYVMEVDNIRDAHSICPLN